MASEQSAAPSKTPWTKIFTAFKIALDLKKLTLAALGILFVWLGWLVIGWTFYGTRTFPDWKNYEDKEKKEPAERKAQWDHFKAKRASWNLLHELAASPSDRKPEDAGDVADSPEEYAVLSDWEQGYRRGEDLATLKDKTALRVPGLSGEFRVTITDADAKLSDSEKFPFKAITIVDADKKQIRIYGWTATVEDKFKELKDHRQGVYSEEKIAELAHELRLKDPNLAAKVYDTFAAYLKEPRFKKSGLLRIDPWSENRGGNPYLLVAANVKNSGRSDLTANQLLTWLHSEELPVVLEPLYKFLTPLVYLFDPRAGFLDRLYLILIILWTLAIWGFFGGAICRIAAVQVARNERIPLKEAILFAKERFASYFAAPVFPLLLISIFVLLLMLFGWVEWIPWVGDLFAGVFWPIVLLLGFIIAIVLVGLVGWPLMIATISTEGTDSFDALSRSYSYVYQAPWQYLWYGFLAVVYGAVLVFFVGFMASLMVFLGKWGVSSAVGLSNPDPKFDREPSYLFNYAPTSFGWRDLLISSNARFVEEKTEMSYTGRDVKRLEFKPEYKNEISSMNSVGAFLVACWLYPLFLLVIGFGYSFFWSASTIIYFLMRHKVDDTEMEEVHLEDEELEDPFQKQAPPPPAPAPAAPAAKPGTLSLNVVDAPPAPTSYSADVKPLTANGEPAPPPDNPPASST